jgi:hypothetical protein
MLADDLNVKCLGTPRSGHPRHPLYLAKIHQTESIRMGRMTDYAPLPQGLEVGQRIRVVDGRDVGYLGRIIGRGPRSTDGASVEFELELGRLGGDERSSTRCAG